MGKEWQLCMLAALAPDHSVSGGGQEKRKARVNGSRVNRALFSALSSEWDVKCNKLGFPLVLGVLFFAHQFSARCVRSWPLIRVRGHQVWDRFWETILICFNSRRREWSSSLSKYFKPKPLKQVLVFPKPLVLLIEILGK